MALSLNSWDRPRLILKDSFREIRIPLGLEAYYRTFTGTRSPELLGPVNYWAKY
jgi:hypothetical protein